MKEMTKSTMFSEVKQEYENALHGFTERYAKARDAMLENGSAEEEYLLYHCCCACMEYGKRALTNAMYEEMGKDAEKWTKFPVRYKRFQNMFEETFGIRPAKVRGRLLPCSVSFTFWEAEFEPFGSITLPDQIKLPQEPVFTRSTDEIEPAMREALVGYHELRAFKNTVEFPVYLEKIGELDEKYKHDRPYLSAMRDSSRLYGNLEAGRRGLPAYMKMGGNKR